MQPLARWPKQRDMRAMPKRAASPARHRGATATKPPGRKRVPPRKKRLLQTLQWLPPTILGIAVFIAGLTLDPDGLIGIFWASLTGRFGTTARVAVLAVVLACASPAFLAAYRYAASPAPLPTRKKPRRQAAPRRTTQTEKPSRPGKAPSTGPESSSQAKS
jgi:hypothetical protein